METEPNPFVEPEVIPAGVPEPLEPGEGTGEDIIETTPDVPEE